jgi:hypothetical protein
MLLTFAGGRCFHRRMRLPKALLLEVFGLVFLLAVPARAQFYAPDTEYHDAVQRVYPVEAARILAWQANQKANRIAEVSYTVSTTTKGTTSWQLSWLDAKGKPIKTAKVQYASSLLKQGPGFYREVMRQLLSSGWDGIQPMKPEEATAAFWKGADQAGLSREQSLDRAFALVSSNQKDGAWTPQLAGLLVHAALPHFGGHISLDDQLVARGAAWLALTERACSNELTRLWGPVLFLAGRDRAASETWNKGGNANSPPPRDGPIAAWNLWLKHPKTKEAFLFAVDSTNKPIAMAMLAWDVQVNGSGNLLAEMVMPWMGSGNALAGLHNYAPLFAVGTGISGGHIMNGAWPVWQRNAWVNLLLRHHDGSVEGLDFTSVLDSVTNAIAGLPRSWGEEDACLYAFNETAPLLQMGQKEGVGKLTPTAVATVRDLLNYGWEATGLQMGARYCFVDKRWCVHEHAKPILETATSKVQGLYPFFKNAQDAHIYNYQQCLFRLQRVDGIYGFTGWSPNPFCGDEITANRCAEVFMKRRWLCPGLFDWQARSFYEEGRVDLIGALVDSVRQEAGPMGAAAALQYFTSIRRDRLGPLAPKAGEWMAKLAEQLPQPTKLSINAVWQKEFADRPPLDTARELERLYWQNPDCEMEDWVFLYYAKAGAFNAARRFYLESRENLLDSVKTSNALGHYAYLVGYLKNDASLREMALEDSRSASAADMQLHIWDAAIRDDREQLTEQVDELFERYDSEKGPKSRGARLQQFLPLLPALANADDPKHKQAIGHFGNDPDWVVLRWLWIAKLKLPKDEAIAFLGGRETDATRRVLVCYLDGNTQETWSAAEALMHQVGTSAEQCILAKFLSMKAGKDGKDATEPDVPDLKPVGASSARSAVLARLAQKQE